MSYLKHQAAASAAAIKQVSCGRISELVTADLMSTAWTELEIRNINRALTALKKILEEEGVDYEQTI